MGKKNIELQVKIYGQKYKVEKTDSKLNFELI